MMKASVVLIVSILLSGCASLSPLSPKVKNTLSCRYRTTDGHLFETTGRTVWLNDKIYPLERNGNHFLWSCASSENQCPLFLKNNVSFLPANLYFVVNDSMNEEARTTFTQDAMESCLKVTQHKDTTFVEFGVKSSTDAQTTFFHKPFFERVKTTEAMPFGRMVVFGDSLSDNGNAFALSKQIVQWPYFIGRFSNGPVWVEDIANTLTEQKKTPVDLYNYALGGAGTGYVAHSPFSLGKQVRLYLSTMDDTCAPDAKGCRKNKWDPSYDKTLFVIFSGVSDYMYCAAQNTQMRSQNCLCDSADDCADVIVNGRTKHGDTIPGIKNEILQIIGHAKEANNQSARYFMVPNLPDISRSPYYTKVLSKNNPQTKFVQNALVTHNTLLKKALAAIQKNYPEVKILQLDLSQFIGNSIGNPQYPPMLRSGITNTTDRCFLGSPVSSMASLCKEPASYLFWDYIHPTMTAHCVIAEYAIGEIHSIFLKPSTYAPNYERCHNSYVIH